MARLSKYFSPALEDRDRLTLVKALGLNNAVFNLTEEFCGQKLLSQEWGYQGGATQILEGLDLKERKESSSPLMGEIWVQHERLIDELKNGDEGSSLFGRVLSYPYCLFFSNGLPRSKVLFSPQGFFSQVQEIRDISARFESQLSNYELSVLWVRGIDISLPVLLHFVRKKLIRVGTLSSLDALTQRFDERVLSPSDLRQLFGTQAAFFELNLSLFLEHDCPLARLKAAINRCLTQPESRVLGEPTYVPESPPFLDFEL